jgi:hypothetical protein
MVTEETARCDHCGAGLVFQWTVPIGQEPAWDAGTMAPSIPCAFCDLGAATAFVPSNAVGYVRHVRWDPPPSIQAYRGEIVHFRSVVRL